VKYFDLKVGFTCNNDCIHCVVADKKNTGDLSTQEIKRIIDNVPQDYVVGFTGGEATIRPDFLELLTYVKKAGHRASLQTNGTQFADLDFAKEASKLLDGVLIAIHSHLPKIHDEIVRKDGMYDKTIKGFKNILALKIPCLTQTVISKLNMIDLPETYDFIQACKPTIRMNLTFPHPNGNALHNAKHAVPKFSELKHTLQRILGKYAALLNTEAIPLCYLHPYQDDVFNFDNNLINGDHKPGIDPSNKDNEFFNEEGITENYALCTLNEKRKGPKCVECVFNERCVGVWKEYLDIHGKDFLEFSPLLEPKSRY